MPFKDTFIQMEKYLIGCQQQFSSLKEIGFEKTNEKG